MGFVVLPSGVSVPVSELHGMINLHHLLLDLKSPNYTSTYRIKIIKAISNLGRHAWTAKKYFEELVKSDQKEVADVAKEALAKMQGLPHFSPSCVSVNKSNPLDDIAANTYGVDTFVPAQVRERHRVDIIPIESEELDDGAQVFYRCAFCNKVCLATEKQRSYCSKLTASSKFYCNFCLKNDFYTNSSNIFIMSFRSLIGYYYYCFFAIPRQSPMQLGDIEDLIFLHFNIGEKNPLWKYDSETFCWFIDFRKIGKSKHKMSLESTLETVVEVLAGFQMFENIRNVSPHKLYKKYKDSITSFYHDRTRPAGNILVPTLLACDIPKHINDNQKSIPVDVLKNFLPSSLLAGSYFGKNKR